MRPNRKYCMRSWNGKHNKLRPVQPFSAANKQSRMDACKFWLSFEEEWFERVIWSNEKWFVLNQSPHSQNDRYWSPVNRHELVECKKAHGEKATAWVSIIDGRCLSVVWFDWSVNGKVCLEKACCNKEIILVSTKWSKLPRYRTMFVIFTMEICRLNHLSQHATSFASIFARPFTTGLFFSEPMYAICEERKAQKPMWSPSARQQICENIDEEVLRKMKRHNRKRAALCIDSLDCHFEQLL